MSPVAGTTRYFCPLECGWHYDVPPVSLERLAELGAAIDPAVDVSDVASFARQAYFAEARQTDAVAREHLATHTTDQFVRTIQTLRAEVARLGSEVGGRMPEPPPLAPDEQRAILSPGWVQLPPGTEDRYPPDFIERMNQPRGRPTA